MYIICTYEYVHQIDATGSLLSSLGRHFSLPEIDINARAGVYKL
jgi:hypothetical protein